MKRVAAVLLAALLLLLPGGKPSYASAGDAPHGPARAEPETGGTGDAAVPIPQTQAGGTALMEMNSMRLLAGTNEHSRLPMASTTKIMTALLAIERCDLDAMVEIPSEAVGTEGSSMYLARGEALRLTDLLYGLMLTSGNDAAVAVAIHIAGSVEAFAELMNARAAELGCTDTNFVTPNGLHDGNHYTSASDLCRIACAAMRSEVFRQIVSAEYYETTTGDKVRVLKNKNRILWEYDGGNGVKTGFTKAAGRCLAFSAERGGTQLVGVVLACPQMWDEAKTLLDYGFSAYRTATLLEGGTAVGYTAVEGGDKKGLALFAKDDILYPIAKSGTDAVEWKIECEDTVSAPVAAGTCLGTLTLVVNGAEAVRTDLVTEEGAAAADLAHYLKEILQRFRAA